MKFITANSEPHVRAEVEARGNGRWLDIKIDAIKLVEISPNGLISTFNAAGVDSLIGTLKFSEEGRPYIDLF